MRGKRTHGEQVREVKFRKSFAQFLLLKEDTRLAAAENNTRKYNEEIGGTSEVSELPTRAQQKSIHAELGGPLIFR